jgi:hypothetical protein
MKDAEINRTGAGTLGELASWPRSIRSPCCAASGKARLFGHAQRRFGAGHSGLDKPCARRTVRGMTGTLLGLETGIIIVADAEKSARSAAAPARVGVSACLAM